MKPRINIYSQISSFYSFVFDNQDKVNQSHVSLYMFLINQNNRSNWSEWFKMPFDLAMAGACIGSKSTYYKCLNDLQDWGLLKYVKGKNDVKAPMISIFQLSNSEPLTVPLSEPLTVPLSGNLSEQLSVLLTGNIDILITDNYELITNNIYKWIKNELSEKPIEKPKKSKKEIPTLDQFLNYVLTIPEFAPKFESLKYSIQSKYEQWIENGWKDGHGNEIKQWKTKLKNTLPHLKQLNTLQNGISTKQTMDERIAEAKRRASEKRSGQMPSIWSEPESFSDYETL